MARVEWTRQSGEDVEVVIAMLLCSRFPNAVRVRPSQGDGGVDVFLPGPAGFGEERAVYQVKKYCENLTSTQKRKIKASYAKAVEASKRESWRITEWHLVMPLDLTSQNLGWLDGVIENAEFPCETNGLVFCDTMAADYPNVVDYYLRDGKDRLQTELSNLTAIIAGQRKREEGKALAPGDVYPDLSSIHKSLNACDPFYRYNFAVSDKPPPPEPVSVDEGLVAVCAMRHDSVWITFEIVARSLAALEESPINLQFKLAIPADDDELRQQVEKFIDYGAPLSLPAGVVSGSLDLPGGLGGDLRGASLQVLSVFDEVDAEETELAVAVIEPDSDAVIASTTITRTELTSGEGGGYRGIWTDSAGLFTIEMLARNGDHRQLAWNFSYEYDLNGRRPGDVVDSLKFIAANHGPNRIGIGLPYGPKDFTLSGAAPGQPDHETKALVVVVDALARLQDHVSVLLRMPGDLTQGQARAIVEAAKLVAGEAVRGPLTGPFTVHHKEALADSPVEPDMDKIYEFVAIKGIEFALGDVETSVGKQALFFRGRYQEIGMEESRIEPVSEGVSLRYTGDLEVTRVMVRPLPHEGFSAERSGET
jgi:hypothetical protein